MTFIDSVEAAYRDLAHGSLIRFYALLDMGATHEIYETILSQGKDAVYDLVADEIAGRVITALQVEPMPQEERVSIPLSTDGCVVTLQIRGWPLVKHYLWAGRGDRIIWVRSTFGPQSS